MKTLDKFIQKYRILVVLKHIENNSTILDVGAYHGELFRTLGDKLREGVGVEPLLEEKIVSDHFVIYPDEFPFKADTVKSQRYDYITMLAVLEHLPENLYNSLANDFYKLLKPGGRVIITVPSLKVDKILSILSALKLIDGMSLEEHHGYLPDDTVKIFNQPRFELVTRKTFQLGLNNLFVFKKV